MLNQLIYTRCSPHRDIKNSGNVVRGDGFGVFSMSAELFADTEIPNFDFMQMRLPIKNASNETSPVGLLNSYEYFSITPSRHGFMYEFSRPHCKTPRKNGQTHRSGTYIKQCLVGEIEGYPYEWFGSDVWDAHLKSENDYYLDDSSNAGPDMLPQVSEKPLPAKIKASNIQSFVNDGRKDAVRAAVWFLIQEYEKIESERKVLLIKDTPENVELWIAAIEYAFSAKMAQKITFVTNRSKLGTQADSTLFYYNDEHGRFSQIQNRSIVQTRHPYCMIVGYHPKDTFCAALKPMATSNFVLVDGVSKTVSFETDPSAHKPYYDAILRYDDNIRDFCRTVLPSLNISEVTNELPALYDAFKYLLDSEHKSNTWRYRETFAHLRQLLKFGTPNNKALVDYLLDECIIVYSHMIEEDIQQGLPLLGNMCLLAKAARRETDVIAIIMDHMQNLLENITASDTALISTWNALKTLDVAMLTKPVLCNLFNDTELEVYFRQFPQAKADVVDAILEMFFVMLSQTGADYSDINKNQTQYLFVCTAFVSISRDPRLLKKNLIIISRYPALLNAVALSVADYFEGRDEKRVTEWWDAVVLTGGGNLPDLCRNLSKTGKASIALIEQLLANHIKKTRLCDLSVMQAFVESIKVLGATDNTGIQLFDAWISISRPSEYSKIIRAAQSCKLSKKAETYIFRRLDNAIPYEMQHGEIGPHYSDMNAWANRLGTFSTSATLAEFRKAFTKARKEDVAITAISNMAVHKLTIQPSFHRGDYFADLVKRASEFESGAVHLNLLCAFMFDEAEINANNQYFNAYVSAILQQAKGHRIIGAMIALADSVTYAYKIQHRTKTYVETVQAVLERILVNNFAKYYKPNMIEQISRSNQCESNVKMKLVTLLKEASKKIPTSNNGGIFGLFGKK